MTNLSDEEKHSVIMSLYKSGKLHAGEVHSLNLIDGCRSLDIAVYWYTKEDGSSIMLTSTTGAKQMAHEEDAIEKLYLTIYDKLIKRGII